MSDPQLTPGRVNPAAAPGVAHAPLVGVDVVVRTKPNARPKPAPELAAYRVNPFDITRHRPCRIPWHNPCPGLGGDARPDVTPG